MNPKAPPHSAEAESSVLGALILDPSHIEESRKILAPECFFYGHNRTIYEALLVASPQSLDLVTLKDALRGDLEKIGGVTYLASLVASVPAASRWKDYAAAVRRDWKRRKLIALSVDLARKVDGQETLNGEFVELAEAGKSYVEDGIADSLPMAVPASAIENLDLGGVDWLIEPLAAHGCMTMCQGAPKMGKSVFSLFAALCVAKGVWTSGRFEVARPARVVYLGYEDNLRRQQSRLLQYNAPLSLGGLPEILTLYERPPRMFLNTPEGIGTLRSLIERDKPEMLVIDTLSKVRKSVV